MSAIATRRAPAQTSQNSRPSGDVSAAPAPKPPAEILFQKYFKSVGPRTYAAQLKRAGNGNHFLVLTEGKRDEKTGDVRKTRLFLFSEDFIPFFRMLHETAQFIRANPVSDEVKKKRDRYWSKKGVENRQAAPPTPGHESMQGATEQSAKKEIAGAARANRKIAFKPR